MTKEIQEDIAHWLEQYNVHVENESEEDYDYECALYDAKAILQKIHDWYNDTAPVEWVSRFELGLAGFDANGVDMYAFADELRNYLEDGCYQDAIYVTAKKFNLKEIE